MPDAIPKPVDFEAKLTDLAYIASQLGPLWRWLEPSAFSRSRHSDAGPSASSQQCRRCAGGGSVCVKCHGALSGDGICPRCDHPENLPKVVCDDCGGDGAFFTSPDQVGSLVVATDGVRTKLRHAAREVADAHNRLRGAWADLNDAARMLDPRPGAVPVASLPDPVLRRELAEARKAQERRRRRAEETGDYSEVTG